MDDLGIILEIKKKQNKNGPRRFEFKVNDERQGQRERTDEIHSKGNPWRLRNVKETKNQKIKHKIK